MEIPQSSLKVTMAAATGVSLYRHEQPPSLSLSPPPPLGSALIAGVRGHEGVTVMLADILRSCDCLQGLWTGRADGVGGGGGGIKAVSHEGL